MGKDNYKTDFVSVVKVIIILEYIKIHIFIIAPPPHVVHTCTYIFVLFAHQKDGDKLKEV